MASLPLSISPTTTPAFLRNNPRRTTVSCNAGRNLDRRDLLLGMGGLYGATNLVVPDVLADPIVTEQNCARASVKNKKAKVTTEVECCPKPSEEVVDYSFPEFKKPRVRPAAHSVSKEYIEKYKDAICNMKDLPSDDPRSFINQANVHCAYCDNAYDIPSSDPVKKLQVHFSWFFFPWHRWYLYFYERILGNLIGDDSFALPFWNWDNPTGMQIPPMFADKNSVLSRARRNQKHLPRPDRFIPADLRFSGEETGDPILVVATNLSTMYSEMVKVANEGTLEDFYGHKYSLNSGNPSPEGAGAVERGSHTAVHKWCGDPTAPVGEDMGHFYSSGKDPLFFSHHANVDRLWTVWRGIASSKRLETEFTDSDWLDTSFLFYDENAKLVRVKVRDSVETEKMGYAYEGPMELPWLNKKPMARTKKSRVAFTSDAPNAADPGIFPVTLDKVVSVLVDRPKNTGSSEDKEKLKELLLIEGIDVDSSKFVRFEVFINDEDDEPGNIIRYAEYAGAYSQVPQTSGGNTKSMMRLGLTELLKELDVEDDDKILVSLVPRAGGEDVTVGGVKIVYV